jgi:hypothetical protein
MKERCVIQYLHSSGSRTYREGWSIYSQILRGACLSSEVQELFPSRYTENVNLQEASIKPW